MIRPPDLVSKGTRHTRSGTNAYRSEAQGPLDAWASVHERGPQRGRRRTRTQPRSPRRVRCARGRDREAAVFPGVGHRPPGDVPPGRRLGGAAGAGGAPRRAGRPVLRTDGRQALLPRGPGVGGCGDRARERPQLLRSGRTPRGRGGQPLGAAAREQARRGHQGGGRQRAEPRSDPAQAGVRGAGGAPVPDHRAEPCRLRQGPRRHLPRPGARLVHHPGVPGGAVRRVPRGADGRARGAGGRFRGEHLGFGRPGGHHAARRRRPVARPELAAGRGDAGQRLRRHLERPLVVRRRGLRQLRAVGGARRRRARRPGGDAALRLRAHPARDPPGGHAPRRRHGDAVDHAPGRARLHHLEGPRARAGRGRHQHLQHLGARHRRLHARAPTARARRARSGRSPSTPGRPASPG